MNHLQSGFGTTEGKTVPELADAGFVACAHPSRRGRSGTQGKITGWLTSALRRLTSTPGGWRRALGVVPVLLFWTGSPRLLADDATIKQDGPQWRLETGTMERVVALEDGKLLLKSFKNKASGRELIPPGTPSEEFFVSVNWSTNRWSGSMGGWKLANSKVTQLSQGEQQLEICLQREALQVTKSYLIYPESSIVREWAAFKNTGVTPLRVLEPGFLSLSLRPGELRALELHWMTGGDNAPGSWKLKTEKLSSQPPRKFDSYEPFPAGPTAASSQYPGDGVHAKVRLNDQQVWPASGWAFSAKATVTIPFDFPIEVKAGDQLVFLVNMKGSIGFDTTAFDPTITYADGETHVASKEFSNRQGQRGWRYQYLENGRFIDLVYYAGPNQWRKAKDNATGTPFVGPGHQHPDQNQDAARVWTAPHAGQVRITGSVCNSGNGGGGSAGYGFRPGTSTYAPWYALYSKDTQEGLCIGWDYFGHWTSAFSAGQDGAVTVQLKVAGHKQTLAPGESVTTPKALVGLFREDLDHAGNECLDWQYRYLWDYTRDGWFPAIRMLGYWYNGTGWGQTGVGWTGGQPDFQSTFRKVFRVADLMRYVGADVYHRDWGWWDRAGDWNGPDFRTTIQYLGKSGMGQLIYAFLYTVDGQSKVAREHPQWLLGGTLDMSRPEVVEFLKGQLDGFVERWGNFEWRNDSFFTAARNGDDTPMLGQDAGFRKVIRDFLDRHPHCAFQAVNGGGNYGGYDYTRYASSFSFSDGAVGPLRNYHAALLFPPDKTSDIPDIWNPNDYNKATWRGLLCLNFDMTGDTWDPAKLEGVRELIDIYHYLQSQGVVGRWVHVYRPLIDGDDPTMYFQRLSRDGRRGLVIPKKPAPGPVTIKPKGLQAAETYLVSFQESTRSESRTGADLMERGVQLEKMAPGELIYLNLPLHPGSQLDTEPPAPPSQIHKSARENMGYPGVELSWKAGSDNNWVSYYEVFRDGVALDKVAKGTFYFDHSAGADLAARYELRTVDGAGNPSANAVAAGPAGKPATVVDDAAAGGFKFSGQWDHPANLLLAHARTLSSSSQKGAVAQIDFQGRNVLVFSKLGTNCGEVAIRIDDASPEIVDTYSADDIWGVCIYRKKLATPGPHQLRLEVLGRHNPRAKGGVVHLDGVRIEAE
jgi:hypothetical protein